MILVSVRAAMAIAVVACGAMVSSCGGSTPSAPQQTAATPIDHNADDIAFVQNMIPHHEQAVQMTQLVPTNTTNTQVITLAEGISANQLPEIGAFRAKLVEWEEQDPGSTSGHHESAMAGMLDQATLDKLAALRGAEFDKLWLTSMIAHHQGAIAVAQAEIGRGINPDMRYLAQRVISAQQAEITQMNQMLGVR